MDLIISFLSIQEVQLGIAVLLAVVGMFFVGYVGERVAADARLSKYANAFKLLREKAADWIITIAYTDVNLRDYNGIDYNEKAEALTEKFGRKIDPRMAFLVDRLEDETVKKLGLKIELEEVLALAERRYHELRFGNNGLILNPSDAPAAPAAQVLPANPIRKSKLAPITE
jgi:hypothetical protein